MNWDQFTNWAMSQGSVGKYDDGAYSGECVSLINQACWRVLNIPARAWGHAKDWAVNAAPLQYFNKVSGVPQKGDVLVYGSSFGGGFGHIEIALGGGRALFQNRSPFVRRVGTGNVLPGYYAILRAKNTPVGEVEVKIGSEPNWRGRMNRLHRQLVGNWDMSDEVFKSIQGHDAWKIVESWSDHSSANATQGYQEQGETSVRDNWPQQIYDRTAERDAARQMAANNEAAAEKARADARELEAKNKELTEAVGKLTATQESDKAAGDSLLRRLGQFITKYLPGGNRE